MNRGYLKEKKKLGDITPVIVLSCLGEYEYVREAMKLGAYDISVSLFTFTDASFLTCSSNESKSCGFAESFTQIVFIEHELDIKG